MGTPQRIEQIQDYLQTQADDRFVNLIYGMIKAEQENDPYELSEAHKQVLDQRLASHAKNPSEGQSWEEVKASLQAK
ncbi:MAG: addiction module protein [Reichenbachiella sp.]